MQKVTAPFSSKQVRRCLPCRESCSLETLLSGKKLTFAFSWEADGLGLNRNIFFFLLEEREILNMDVMKRALKF